MTAHEAALRAALERLLPLVPMPHRTDARHAKQDAKVRAAIEQARAALAAAPAGEWECGSTTDGIHQCSRPAGHKGMHRKRLAAAPAAPALEVERLARALARCAEVGPPANHTPEQAEEHWPEYRMEAEDYAAEYERLERTR